LLEASEDLLGWKEDITVRSLLKALIRWDTLDDKSLKAPDVQAIVSRVVMIYSTGPDGSRRIVSLNVSIIEQVEWQATSTLTW
jgi:hypothetical protein